MVQTIDVCDKKMAAMGKLISDSSEFEIMKTFNNQYQVEAYRIKKKQENLSALFKLILKIASEISVITGAISVLLQVFL